MRVCADSQRAGEAPRGRHADPRSGQTVVEYIIVATMLVLTMAILAVFLYTFKQYGARVLDLIASEYP